MNTITEHVSFEDMTEYVFHNNALDNDSFVEESARIQSHIFNCKECRTLYNALLTLKESLDAFDTYQTSQEILFSKVFRFFYMSGTIPAEKITELCLKFRKWISFGFIDIKEIFSVSSDTLFNHPKLIGIMNSVSDDKSGGDRETLIKTSLIDKNNNRITIGMDGTLSLYFDSTKHPEGKRIIIIPDNDNADTKMLELTEYEESISNVRFEGITPGEYTILIEE